MKTEGHSEVGERQVGPLPSTAVTLVIGTRGLSEDVVEVRQGLPPTRRGVS